jgi:hypothetical protein
MQEIRQMLARISDLERMPWDRRQPDEWEAWIRLRRLTAEAIEQLLASGCACCGRPWSLRLIASRILGFPRYATKREPISHATIDRLRRPDDWRRGGDRVDRRTVRMIARQLADLEWVPPSALGGGGDG